MTEKTGAAEGAPRHSTSPSKEYPLRPGTCPSGAHMAGDCQCSGIPNLQATITLLEGNLAQERAAREAAEREAARWKDAWRLSQDMMALILAQRKGG